MGEYSHMQTFPWSLSLWTLFPNSLSSYSQTWFKSVSERTKEYLHKRSLWTNWWQAVSLVWFSSPLVSPHVVCPVNTSSFWLHAWPVWWSGGIQLSDHLRSPDLMYLPEKWPPLMHSLSPCLHRCSASLSGTWESLPWSSPGPLKITEFPSYSFWLRRNLREEWFLTFPLIN